jgi:hypothetical protein
MMSIDTTERRESDACAIAVKAMLETAQAAIAGVGNAAPNSAVRGLDIALAGLDYPETDLAPVARDLKFRACNLNRGDSYRRQCVHALTFAAALIEIFLNRD